MSDRIKEDAIEWYESVENRTGQSIETLVDLIMDRTAEALVDDRDKRSHRELPMKATPSVWGNPTEACVSGNAGVVLALRTIWRSLEVYSNNLLG